MNNNLAIKEQDNVPATQTNNLLYAGRSTVLTSFKTCIVPIKAIYSLTGEPISPFSDENLRCNVKIKKSSKISDKIYLIKRSMTHYRLVNGLQLLQNAMIGGTDLVSAIVYTINEKHFDLLSESIQTLQQTGNMHFFDYANHLGKIIDITGISQMELAAWLSVSQPSIGNKLRLLRLSDEVRRAAMSARLTERHCRALLGFEEDDAQLRAINFTVRYNTSSKKLEQISNYMQHQRKLNISDDEYNRQLDNVFLKSSLDLREEIVNFQNNLMREVRVLRTLGIDVYFLQKDKGTFWDIQIHLPKE